MNRRAGESRLEILLEEASPTLHPETYVYGYFADGRVPEGVSPICTFVEPEGLTAVVTRQQAGAIGMAVEPEWALITLSVHSSLEAVGFIARMTGVLAANEIASNVVSAYHHDHIFVPAAKADEALQLLRQLGRER